jgi:hypothetical protein
VQPELKRRGRADRAARARMLLKAHLGWVGGYPLATARGEVSWRAAEPGPHLIDRAAIATSTRAFKRLLGEHRGALPQLVGDVEGWARGVAAALAALKAIVHQGADLGDLFAVHGEEARARRLVAARPSLAPLIAALSWVDVAAPERLAGDLRMLERHGAAFAQLAELSGQDAIDACLRLLGLARAEQGRVAGLMRVLADPDLAATPTVFGEYPDRIKRKLEGADISIGPRPTATLAPVVLELVGWIAAAPAPVRRAALRAIAAADLPRFLGRWRLLWTALEPAEVLALRSREAIDRAPHEHLFRCRASLTWIGELAPSALTAGGLRQAITRLAAADARRLVALVATCPDDDELPVGIEFMIGLAIEVELLGRPKEVGGLVALLRAYLAGSPDPTRAWRVLAPVLLAPSYRFARLLVDFLPTDRWRELGAAMAELVAGGRDVLLVDSLLRLAVLLGATGSAALALRHFPALDGRGVSPWSDGIRAALALAEDPDRFDEVLVQMTQGEGDLAVSVDRVIGATGPAGVPLVRALVSDSETGRLRDAAGWIQLARAIRGCKLPPLEAPAAGRAPAWAARYPGELRAALALAHAAGARAAAERKLDGLFPERDRLLREIAAIDQRLGHGPPHLAARRANLVARLEAPRPLAAARLATLAGEIERGARAALFDRWVAAVEQAVGTAFPRALGLTAAPAWLASREHRAVLVAALGLGGESRRLVRMLLAARSGEPPWDLRGQPANRAFLSRLTRRGVSIGPWLDGTDPMRFDDPSGALELSLEPDPLEVLRMGEHFGTCLSPGGENFFSAVVNTVDINKRVVYGRDAAGAVVGRCLLALTDTGRILTFHAYHHRTEFEAMVRGFATELARRMNTHLVATGTVTPLVASRWYDDGPVDLTGRHEFLAAASTFRDRLGKIPPADLVPALEEHLGSLDGSSLSLVVSLHEVDERPELVVPLLPFIDRAGDIALEIRLRAIQLADRAGAADRLGPRTAEHLATGLEGRLADGRVEREPIDRLAKLSPVRLLGVVRAARRRLPRRERDGRPWLSYAAAVANRALGRTRRAADEYQRAMTASDLHATSHHDLREGCQQALRELSRPAP